MRTCLSMRILGAYNRPGPAQRQTTVLLLSLLFKMRISTLIPLIYFLLRVTQ